MHEITDDVQAMLGKEIGSFCEDFAFYDCNQGSRCLRRHVKFSQLVSAVRKGMQKRRSHCHKCNVRNQRPRPCQLLDVNWETNYKLCRYEVSRRAGCTKTTCNFFHRFPDHMDLKYCRAHLRGSCTGDSCAAPHLSFSTLEVKFNQMLRSLGRNCKKCEALYTDGSCSESGRRYERMSITVDCLAEENVENPEEETVREIELSSSRPDRTTVSKFRDIEWRHSSTESQDSWTKDFS